jgi:hypothetical protein
VVEQELEEVELFLASGQLHYCHTLPDPHVTFTGRFQWMAIDSLTVIINFVCYRE